MKEDREKRGWGERRGEREYFGKMSKEKNAFHCYQNTFICIFMSIYFSQIINYLRTEKIVVFSKSYKVL